MKNLSKFFLENYKLTIVLSLALFVFGFMGLKKMNVESFPAVSLATATITTSYDGATAEDIETKITKPLEDEIRGVTGLKDVRSTSQAGRSTIVVRVDMDDPKVNVGESMSEIQKAIDRTTGLPNDLREAPNFTEIKSDEFPVVELAVIGDNTNRARDLLADELKEELEDNKGLKGVRLTGYSERVFKIQLDIEKMDALHISTDEVLGKVGQRNTNTPGGALKDAVDQRLVRIEGKISNRDELANIVVRSNFSGETIHLKDIAEVLDDRDDDVTIVKHNGIEATLITVTKKGGADTLKIVADINQKLKEFQERHPNYQFKIYNNEGDKIANKVDVLVSNAFSGLVLVIIFLFFFLPGKVGLAASLSLPLAVMGTLGFMPQFGMNIDTITILALVIALGMLVDNSVVISENFTRLRQLGKSPHDAAIESISSLWLPITATAFTTIAAFMPMLVTKGVMGQFIRFIPMVVSISLLISLGESFFFLPMRLAFAGKNVKEVAEDETTDWFHKFEKKFENLMSFLVKRKYLVAVIFSFVILFSFFMVIKANKFILFPAEQTEVYIARVDMPKGTRLEQTAEAVKKISSEVKKVLGKDAEQIVARAGISTMGPNDPKAKEGNNVGMLSIYVSENAKLNIAYTTILNSLRTVKVPGVENLEFEAMVKGPPVGNAIEATFRSNNIEKMNGLLDAISKDLSQIKGVYDLKINDVIGDDEVFIEIDYEKAARLGLNVQSIGSTVRTAISGKRISKVTLHNKEIDLLVRFKEPYRAKTSDLKNITVLDQRGNLVPLSSFATFKTLRGTPQIKRFDFKRSKTLTGNIDEEVITSLVANNYLKKFYEKHKVNFPGVSLTFGGAAESTKESMESLFQALILALIGIFALLVFLFKSYLRPIIIMTTIPLGLLGFSVAFFLHQRPISFMALIGIIGLSGIIVNSGIVLISFIDQMKEEGEMNLDDILIKASGMRLRAVLVTSLTTISGLIPTAYGIGGNDAMLIPMTLSMAWGLTSGTILTLVWVPCAYAILEDFSQLGDRVLASIKGRKKAGNDSFSPEVSHDQ